MLKFHSTSGVALYLSMANDSCEVETYDLEGNCIYLSLNLDNLYELYQWIELHIEALG